MRRPWLLPLCVLGFLTLLAILFFGGRNPHSEGERAIKEPVVIGYIHSVPVAVRTHPLPLVTAHGDTLSGSLTTPIAATDYLAFLHEELGRYSPEFFLEAGIKRIELAENLVLQGKPRGGVNGYFGTFFFDVRLGNTDIQYLRRMVHHEMLHALDFASDYSYRDSVWVERFGPYEGSEIPSSIASENDGVYISYSESHMGFVSALAATSEYEDKAEIFSFAMAQCDLLKGRLGTDPVVREKVSRVLEFVRNETGAEQVDCPLLGVLGNEG